MPRIRDRIISILKELKVPPRLYHYTSQQGLIDILSSRALWSTRIQYLNDSMEFQYALGLLSSAIQGILERVKPKEFQPDAKKMFDIMTRGLESLSGIHIHVACFSESGDDLNLWRGYCPQGSKGFSIGFAQAQLFDAASRQECLLAPCIYDPEKQSELINILFYNFFDELTKAKREGLDITGMSDDFFLDCIFLACVFKHPCFKEEHEWRIVTQELPDTHGQIGVRQGKIVPIPYFRFELVQPEEKLDVVVVVGPTPEMELSKAAVATLLNHHSCAGAIKSSTVPYREV